MLFGVKIETPLIEKCAIFETLNSLFSPELISIFIDFVSLLIVMRFD